MLLFFFPRSGTGAAAALFFFKASMRRGVAKACEYRPLFGKAIVPAGVAESGAL